MAGDQASHQGGSVPDRAQRDDVEGVDPQLLRADHSDARGSRDWRQLRRAAQRRQGGDRRGAAERAAGAVDAAVQHPAANFADSSITYLVQFWIGDYARRLAGARPGAHQHLVHVPPPRHRDSLPDSDSSSNATSGRSDPKADIVSGGRPSGRDRSVCDACRRNRVSSCRAPRRSTSSRPAKRSCVRARGAARCTSC